MVSNTSRNGGAVMIGLNRRRTTINNISRLPTGYTEVEYIQNNGTAYINIGVIASKALSFNVKFNRVGGTKHIFGSRSSYYANNSGVQLEGNRLYIKWGNTDIIGNPSVDAYKTIEIYSKNNDTTVILDGSSILTYTTSYGNGYYNGNMYLFAFNNNGSLLNNNIAVKIYKFTIYNGNEETILDFVPCINPNSEVGMYDLVSNTFFGNQGSGIFIAGEPI